MERGLTPRELALEDVPKVWYELSHKQHIALMVLSSLSLNYSNEFIFHLDSLPAHVTSAMIFVISTLADRYSTFKAIQADMLGVNTGLDSSIEEQNIVVGEINTPRDAIFNKRMLALDVVGTTFSAVAPGLGIGYALGKFQATANNLRKAKRLNREVSIRNEIEAQNNRS